MSSKAIRAGKAFVELGANDSMLKKGLDAAQAKVRGFGKSIAMVGASMSAAGAAITAPIGVAVASFASAGDALNKMAIRTGMSSEVLSELGFAAEQSGSNLETLSSAMMTMTRRVANAAKEGGPAQRAIEAIGLSATELASMTPEDQLGAIADGLNGLGDSGFAAQLGFEIFGLKVNSILPLLSAGSDGIEDLRGQARDLGISMSTTDSAAAARFNDSLNILNKSIEKVWHVIAAAVVPALTNMIQYVTPVVTGVISWADANRQLIMSVAGLAAGLGIAGTVLVMVGGAVMVLPVKLFAVVAAVGAAGAAFLHFTDIGGQMLGWFTSEFGKLITIGQQTMQGVYNAMVGGRLELAAEILMTGIKLAFASGMESVLGLFGSNIDDMMAMLADVFKRLSQIVNRVNVARTSVVNFLSGAIGGALGIDTSFEQAQAMKAAQQGLDDAMNFDSKKAGKSWASMFDTDKLKEKLDNLNSAAAEAADAVEQSDMSIKQFEYAADDIDLGMSSGSSQIEKATLGTFSGAFANQTAGTVAFQEKQLDLSRKIERNTRQPAPQEQLVVT